MAAKAPLIMPAQHIPALKGLKEIATFVGDKDSLLASNEAEHAELQRIHRSEGRRKEPVRAMSELGRAAML